MIAYAEPLRITGSPFSSSKLILTAAQAFSVGPCFTIAFWTTSMRDVFLSNGTDKECTLNAINVAPTERVNPVRPVNSKHHRIIGPIGTADLKLCESYQLNIIPKLWSHISASNVLNLFSLSIHQSIAVHAFTCPQDQWIRARSISACRTMVLLISLRINFQNCSYCHY